MNEPNTAGNKTHPSPGEGTASLVPDISRQLADLDEHDLDTQISLLGRADAQLRSALEATRPRT